MWRLIFPLLVIGVAAYVWYEGHDGDAVFLVFPYVEQIPGVGEDFVARAEASAWILGGVGVVTAVVTTVLQLRARRGRDDER